MSRQNNTGLSHGTSGSPQEKLESLEYAAKVHVWVYIVQRVATVSIGVRKLSGRVRRKPQSKERVIESCAERFLQTPQSPHRNNVWIQHSHLHCTYSQPTWNCLRVFQRGVPCCHKFQSLLTFASNRFHSEQVEEASSSDKLQTQNNCTAGTSSNRQTTHCLDMRPMRSQDFIFMEPQKTYFHHNRPSKKVRYQTPCI